MVAYGGLEPIIDVLMVFELSLGGNEFPQCGGNIYDTLKGVPLTSVFV